MDKYVDMDMYVYICMYVDMDMYVCNVRMFSIYKIIIAGGVCVVVEVFDLFVFGLYLEKRKNMCKYFSGCGYTVRKSWKVLGA